MAIHEIAHGDTAKQQSSEELHDALRHDGHDMKILPAEFNNFCKYLDAIFERNTRENIQTCKSWILKFIAPSSSRIILLGKYLVSLSQSIDVEGFSSPDKAVRNRLDLVLLISDVLHSTKFHQSVAIEMDLQPFVKQLVALVAIRCHERNTKHEKRLKAVIKFWFINDLFTTEDISDIMESARAGFHRARDSSLPHPRSRKDNLPTYFGDSNATDHDLPAAYVLTRELYLNRRGEPAGIRSQRLPRHPTRKTTDILDAYFQKLDEIYRPTADNPLGAVGGYRQWTDVTGHQIAQHKTTSSTKKITNGFGWSIDMCKQMNESGRVKNVFNAEAGVGGGGMDLDGRRDEANRRRGPYDSDRSRSRSGSQRRHRYSSSDSDHDRRERRRDRSGSRSSYDSRRGRSSSRRGDRALRAERSRSRYGENRDEDARRPQDSERDTGLYKPPPSAPSSHQRNVPPPPPPPQPNTAPPNSTLQPPQFPGNFQPQFAPNQRLGPMPGPFPGQFAPQFPGQATGQFQPPMPGQFPNQYPGQFPVPHFSHPFPAASSPPPPGQANFVGIPNAFPPVGGPGFPAQQGGNGNFGQHQGYGGFNRGGFQGNNFGRGSSYGGNNQRGRGGGGPGWR